MATTILIDKPVVAEIARIYHERLLYQAEIAAKKELTSMSTAIDKAAGKGLFSIEFKLSSAIMRLNAEQRAIADEIIDGDIAATGYSVEKIISKAGATLGYTIGWATEEGGNEQGNQEDPVDPNQGGNEDPNQGGEDPNQGSEDPNQGGEDPNQGGEDPNQGGDDPGQGGSEDIDDEPVLTPAADQDPANYQQATVIVGDSANDLYELIDGVYYATADTEVVAGKTYYQYWEPIDDEDIPPLP